MSSSFQTAVGVGFALPGAQGPNTNTVINATKPATVKVNALSGGYFTIPEEQFVNPCVHGSRATVPSLCFLVQHVCASTGATTRIVFDLGLRRDLSRYSEPIRRHTETRQPITTTPDVVQSLHKAGLTTDDINYVIYSHVRDGLAPVLVVSHKNALCRSCLLLTYAVVIIIRCTGTMSERLVSLPRASLS